MVQVKIIKFSELLDGHRLFINQKLYDVRGVEIVGGPAPAMSLVNFEAREDGSTDWKFFAMPPKFEATILSNPVKKTALDVSREIASIVNAVNGQPHATTHEEVEDLHSYASTDGETWSKNVEPAQTVDFTSNGRLFRAIIVALTLMLAFVSGASAQQQPPGAYSTEIARPLHQINPYISDPSERARLTFMDADAVRIMEAATSSAVIVQATANMPDAPFTFVNLTNASASPIEVLIVYSISGRAQSIHVRQLAPFQRVSIGLHEDVWTFYGRLNMSMTAYFVGRGAMEWSSYRPSPIAGDPPIEVDSKFAEFLPEVR